MANDGRTGDEGREAEARPEGRRSYQAGPSGDYDVRRVRCDVLHEEGAEVLDLISRDVPGVDGAPVPDGAHAWMLCVPLHDGRRLHLHIGPVMHRAWTNICAAEATDDAEEQLRDG